MHEDSLVDVMLRHCNIIDIPSRQLAEGWNAIPDKR